MSYLTNLLIGLDQLANTLLCGAPDETLSARAWREREKHPYWHKLIDLFFGWGHCEQAWYSEAVRRHLPKEYREHDATATE